MATADDIFASRMSDYEALQGVSGQLDVMQQASNRAYQTASEASARRKEMVQKNEKSLINRVGLDEDSFMGGLVNNAAAFAAGASDQVLGNLIAAPANAGAANELSNISTKEMDAYRASILGIATPEQDELLNRKTHNKGGPVDIYRALSGKGDTVRDRIDTARSLNETGRAIGDTFDIGSIVNRTGQSNLENDLRSNFQDNWTKVTEGSATDKVAGVTDLLTGAISAGVDNKGGLATYLSENIPQLAIGLLGKGGRATQMLTNVGYGLDNFQEGVKEYEKKNGTLPTGEDLQKIIAWSGAAAAAEQVGDISVIRGLGKGATQAAGGEAAKRGVVASAANIGKGTAQGFAGEAGTEAFQTVAENKAKFEETSPEDVYVAGAIGGLVGGTMRGGLTTAQEAGKAISTAQEQTSKVIAEREANKADVEEAIKTGDVSKFTTVGSKEYNPGVAVDALYKSAQAKKDDAQVQSDNYEKANAVLAEANAHSSALETRIANAKAPEAVREEVNKEIAATEAQVAAATTPDEIELATLRHQVAKDKMDQLDDDIKRLPKLESQLSSLKTSIEKGNKIVSSFTPVESTTEVDGDTDVEKTINLSMSAPSKVNDAALASLAKKNLSPTQKTYVDAAVSAREATAKAESIDAVNSDVLYGNNKSGKTGVQQYRDRISTALTGNKLDVANAELKRMESFAANHESKAQVAQQVLAERVQAGDNENVTIAPNDKGVWQKLPTALSRQEASAKGYLNIHRGSNRSGLIDAARLEADAVNAAVAEMKAAIALKGSPKPTQPSAKPTAVASVPTASAPQKKKVEKKTESTPAPEKDVAQSTPAVETKPSQTVVPEIQLREETEGGIAVSTNVDDVDSKLGTNFKKENLITKFFKQRSEKDTDASNQPLVDQNDFLTSLDSGEVTIDDFLSFDADSEQVKAVQHFIKFAKKHKSVIEKNIARNANEFSYQDMVEFMKGEDGSITENVSTAIALAAYTWLAENGGQPNYNDDEAIRDMFGMGDFDKVSNDLRQAVIKAGTNERNVIASLGQRAVQSLGLGLTKDAPINLKANLESSIGAQAWKLLDQLGLLERKEVSGALIKASMPANLQANYDENSTTYLTSPKRIDGELSPEVKSIMDAQKGMSSVLNKLFGVESSLIAPTDKPNKQVQQTTKGTDQPVPTKLQEIIKHEDSVPNYLRQDTFGVLTALGMENAMDVVGFNREQPTSMHMTQREGVSAKNDGLVSQLENAFEFFGSRDPDAPMYFKHSVWKQHRVGIETNMINPQTSKIHRFLVSRPEWTTTVKVDDAAMTESLFLRIGEGLGIKTDKQDNAASLSAIRTKLSDETIQDATTALRETMIEGQDMTDAHRAAIVAGVKAGGENMHSLDALIALAYYQDALINDKAEFQVQLMGEIDGVTNGPMLSHLLMGAGTSVSSLFEMLNRGGFYSLNDEDSNYNVWRGKEGKQDLYETTITNVLSRMPDSAGKTAFYTLVGSLADESGKILKAGRNIIKTPLTAMVFGSSLDGAIDSMFDGFVDTIYTKMAESANNPGLKQTNMAAINDLLRMGDAPKDALFKPSDDLLETQLTRSQEKALRKAFDMVIGEAVKDTMDTDFAVFMASRKTVNDAAQASFKMYDAARKGITEMFINQKMDSGDIAYKEFTRYPTKQDRINKTNGFTVREPIHDLTPAQKEELGGLLLPVTPVQATLMSLDSKQADAGLAVSKTGRQFSRNPVYQGEAHFGTPTSTGTKSLKLAAYEFSLSSPGVAMLVMSVHSTDAAISHNAVMGIDSGKPTQVLNVHDAHGSGLGNFEQTARNLNKATWDAMLRYSPAQEMNNTLQRTITGLASLLENPDYAAAIKPYLSDALSYGTKKKPISLYEVASDMSTTAAAADKLKYETLAQMKAVDQYALEGGEYQVTDADRAKAKEKANEVKQTMPTSVLDTIGSLEAVAKSKVTPKKVDTDVEYQNETRPEPAKALGKTMTAAKVGSLASVVQEASALNESIASGTPVETAVNSLPEAQQAQVVQALAEASNKLPQAGFSPWGEIGTSNVDHDMDMVANLQANPVMNKDQVLYMVRESIVNSQMPKNIREFNVKLYQMLKKTAPDNLQVKYVTPTTSSNEVMGKGASKSRGWYMSKGDANQIYVLSTDHKYAGITPELLLHELTHSVLAGLVESEMDAKAKDSSYTSEALELIDNLEALRTKAQAHMAKNNLGHLSPAVSNIHEFISWGMTNLEFQRDVLSKISTKAAKNSNSLISGMKAFIKNVVGILFRGSDKSTQAITSNGLAQMVANTSGLIYAASQKKSTTDILLNQQAADPMNAVEKMDSVALYEAIADTNPNNQPSIEFGAHLQDILINLVSKIHDPMGVIKEVAKANQTLTAMDVYSKALATGKLPFASLATTSGFKVNNQEAFVMEQIEATVRAALNSNETQTTAAYSELRRVFELARKKLKPADFLPTGVTEVTASVDQMDEAHALWNAAFMSEADAGNQSNYMAKFVALALGNEVFASKLGFDATRTKRDPDNLWDRAMAVLDTLVNWVMGKLTKTEGLVDADDFIKQLAEQLVDIEAKRRAHVPNQFDDVMSGVEDKLTKLGDAAQQKVLKVGQSAFFKQSKSGFVRAAGLAVTLVAAPERVHGILDGINAVRDKHLTERQGMLSSMITEMRGLDGAKDVFLKLLLGTKNIERERAAMTASVGKAVMESFAKKEFTKEEQKAVTGVFLRNDLASLVDLYSIADIQKLVADKAYRDAEIAKLESAVSITKFANAMLNQASALGYFLATGVSKHPNLMLNAHNITRLGGTANKGKLSEEVSASLDANVDALVSLYALRYTNQTDMNTAAAIFKSEAARKDGGNGVEAVIKLHKELQRDSKDRLFKGADALVQKGYLPEITNPYITFKVADALEGAELLRMGYTKGKKVGSDPTDQLISDRHIYTLRDGGVQRYLSSMVSFTGNQRKGSSNQRDGSTEVQNIFPKKAAIEARINRGLIDPAGVQDTYTVPVLNASGQVVNYRYMMSGATRDNLLERDNRFENLLGTMAGNTFDKVSSPDQNKLIMTALKEQYEAEKGTDVARYQVISPKSGEAEYRDLWNMLPDQTKRDIEAIWGSKEIRVRNDMMDLVFGYRKESLSTLWDKDDRKFYEEALVFSVEAALRAWAVTKGIDPETMAERAKYFVRKGEDMWQSVVSELKDIVVVRTGTVLFGNIMSNFSVLGWYGVPVKEMIRHHRVALKAAQDYQRDSYRLTRVQTMLDTGAIEGNDVKELEAEAVRLTDALARNPVKELIDAGLMPTIVEDLSASEDIYSYKSQLARKVEGYTAKVPSTIKKGMEYIYIGQKTPLYQGLNRATQLSDFVARYTLYHHLMDRKNDPVSREEAITRASDAFVNYDIPTHRSTQYLNDMGLLMFTKYYLRIQRVLLQLFQEKPVRGMLMALMGGFVTGMETIHDSNLLGRLGNNPFSLGALRYPTVLDDLATVKAAVSLR